VKLTRIKTLDVRKTIKPSVRGDDSPQFETALVANANQDYARSRLTRRSVLMMLEQDRARERHERILDAALRVFAKKGYREAAVDDIAAESKTSKGGVYFHFPGKQAIFLELLDRTAARLRRKVEEAIDSRDEPIEKADAALLAVFNTFASHRTLARLFMVEALGAGKEFHRRLADLHEEFAQIIKGHLDEAVSQGVIEPVDTETAARAWFGALNQVLTSWVLSRRPGRVADAYSALRPLLMRSVGVLDPGVRRRAIEKAKLSERVREAMERGRLRATTTGAPVPVTAIIPWPPVDLFALMDATNISPRTLWSQPSEALSFLALGQTVLGTGSGQSRFLDVANRLEEFTSQLLVVGDPDITQLPLAVAGFSFDHPRRGEGPNLPEGALVVPRLVFVKTGNLFWLRATVIAEADADPRETARQIEVEVQNLLSEGDGGRQPDCGPFDFREETSPEEWARSVSEIIEPIRAGQVEKAVLARRLVAKTDCPGLPAGLLRRLCEHYPGCTTFAFQLGGACFFGATPERLVRLDGRRLYVDCLAGSTARGETAEEDERLGEALLTDPKERHEHAIVVREPVGQVREVADEVAVGEAPTLRRFSNIQHLYTPITAVPRPGHDLLDLVERLHPTPATGGRPREAALHLIRELEPFDRGWYAGPIGWLDTEGGGEFVVGLRSALMTGDEIAVYGGSGIVAGSEPEREWVEASLKMKAMLWALQPE